MSGNHGLISRNLYYDRDKYYLYALAATTIVFVVFLCILSTAIGGANYNLFQAALGGIGASLGLYFIQLMAITIELGKRYSDTNTFYYGKGQGDTPQKDKGIEPHNQNFGRSSSSHGSSQSESTGLGTPIVFSQDSVLDLGKSNSHDSLSPGLTGFGTPNLSKKSSILKSSSHGSSPSQLIVPGTPNLFKKSPRLYKSISYGSALSRSTAPGTPNVFGYEAELCVIPEEDGENNNALTTPKNTDKSVRGVNK